MRWLMKAQETQEQLMQKLTETVMMAEEGDSPGCHLCHRLDQAQLRGLAPAKTD